MQQTDEVINIFVRRIKRSNQSDFIVRFIPEIEIIALQ